MDAIFRNLTRFFAFAVFSLLAAILVSLIAGSRLSLERFGIGFLWADDWDPVLLEVANDYPGSLAALRLADVLLVNPVRDGMNLVAEEGVVLSEHDCAVVLSREAGIADQYGQDALLVNPYDVTETAEALHAALSIHAVSQSSSKAARIGVAAVPSTPITRTRVSSSSASMKSAVRQASSRVGGAMQRYSSTPCSWCRQIGRS